MLLEVSVRLFLKELAFLCQFLLKLGPFAGVGNGLDDTGMYLQSYSLCLHMLFIAAFPSCRHRSFTSQNDRERHKTFRVSRCCIHILEDLLDLQKMKCLLQNWTSLVAANSLHAGKETVEGFAFHVFSDLRRADTYAYLRWFLLAKLLRAICPFVSGELSMEQGNMQEPLTSPSGKEDISHQNKASHCQSHRLINRCKDWISYSSLLEIMSMLHPGRLLLILGRNSLLFTLHLQRKMKVGKRQIPTRRFSLTLSWAL